MFHHFPSFSIIFHLEQVFPSASRIKNPSEVDILRRGFRSPEAPKALEAPKAIPRTLRIAPMLRGGIFLADSSVGISMVNSG